MISVDTHRWSPFSPPLTGEGRWRRCGSVIVDQVTTLMCNRHSVAVLSTIQVRHNDDCRRDRATVDTGSSEREQVLDTQADQLRSVSQKYDNAKKLWAAAISNLENKIKVMKQEQTS